MTVEQFVSRLTVENNKRKNTHRIGKPATETAIQKWQRQHPDWPLPEPLRHFFLACNGVTLVKDPDAVAEAGGFLRLFRLNELDWAAKALGYEEADELALGDRSVLRCWVGLGVNDNGDWSPVLDARTGEIRICQHSEPDDSHEVLDGFEVFLDWLAQTILDPHQAQLAEAAAARRQPRPNAPSLTEVHIFRESDERFEGLDVSPDGRWVVTAGHESAWQYAEDKSPRRSLRLWCIPDQKMARSYDKHLESELILADGESETRMMYRDRICFAATFSPDGSRVAAVHHSALVVYERDTGELVWSVPVATNSGTVRFSPDGAAIVVTGGSYPVDTTPVVHVISARTGETIAQWEAHRPSTAEAVFTPDGTRLITAGRDKRIKIWEFPKGRLMHTLERTPFATLCLALSPSGKRLVCGSQSARDVQILETDQWSTVARLPGHAKPVQSVCYSPDEQLVGSIDGSDVVRVWSAETGSLKWQYRGLDRNGYASSAYGTGIAFCPDSRHILACGWDYLLWLLRVPD